jgi:hypothetical protein
MHDTHMIGKYWTNIPGYKDREKCMTCNATESMTHILTQYRTWANQIVWPLAQGLWPHCNIPWPEINLGMILGCGCINLQSDNENDQQNRKSTHQGPSRLLQIILSESAYLIWVLRCKRVIQERQHTDHEIQGRWLWVINERLTIDKLTATKIKRN